MEKVAGFIAALIASVFISMAMAYPLMMLWNDCLIPAIPGIKEVEWLQMWGITVLFKAFTSH